MKKMKATSIVMMLILATLLTFSFNVSAAGPNYMGWENDEMDVTIGETFQNPVWFDVSREVDTISIEKNFTQNKSITFLPTGIVNYSSDNTKDNLRGDFFDYESYELMFITPVNNVSNNDINNDEGWVKDFVWAVDAPAGGAVNNSNDTGFNISWDAVGCGVVTLTMVGDGGTARDGNSIETTMYTTASINVHPQDPDSFSIDAEGADWVNMSWASADGIDNYVLFRDKSGFPSDTTGTPLYNGTALYYNDTGLDIEDEYYYSLWGWNETAGFFSLTYQTVLRESENSLPTPFTADTADKTTIDLSWEVGDPTDQITLRPNADGTTNDWTASAGSNYECVDEETANDDTDYIYSSTTGDVSYFALPDVTQSGIIEDVTIHIRARKETDSGGSATIRTVTNVSVDDEQSSNIALTDTWDDYSSTYTTAPDGGAWTFSDIDDLEIGVYAANIFDANANVTQIYATIDYSDATYVIERSESPGPWAQGDGTGTEIYNGTGVSFSDTGLTPDTDYYYQLWTYDGGYSADYLSADNHTTDNNNVTITNPIPADSATDVDKMYSQVSIDLADADGDLIDYTIEGEYLTNVDVSGVSDDTYTADLITPLPYDETITWYVNATDGYDSQTEVFSFTVRSEYDPTPPSDFTATADGRNDIDLSWTSQDDYTYVEWSNSPGPWSIGDEPELFDGTGTSTTHSGLDDDTTYYYQAWSYNTTDNVYSLTYSSANDTTVDNNIPTTPTAQDPDAITDPNDEYHTVYNVHLSVDVEDSDGDAMDVSFYWGNHSLITTETSVTNGTCDINLTDYVDPDWLTHDTNYTWYVVVDDGFDTVNSSIQENRVFWFITSKAWDMNEDKKIDSIDISDFVGNYNDVCTPGSIPEDVNNDGQVETLDVSSFVSHFGETY